ncbi:MAG TPA: aminotransferase class IV, partial [Anaerolineales bacterium]|nr:aminotransferase class IV [Anaerolineales bacterium]
EEISSRFDRPQRVRVFLDRDGRLDVMSLAYDAVQDHRPLKVGLAAGPVDSDNVFLFHKTTQRDVYDSARKGYEHLDDVLLYNERGELTEFTIGNLVLELDGRLFTPPLSCGVLAGTFRAHLLETGQISERTVSIEQLAHCTNLFRINSVRGWQTVEIQG